MNRSQTDEILDLMGIMVSSFPSQAGQDSTAAIRGYMMAIDGCSHRAIDQVLRNIITGRQAGFANKYAPTSGELGEMCRKADQNFRSAEMAARIPEHGIMKLNFGGRDIYTADMPLAEVQELIRTNGESLKNTYAIGGAAKAALDHLPKRVSVGDDAPDGDMGEENAA